MCTSTVTSIPLLLALVLAGCGDDTTSGAGGAGGTGGTSTADGGSTADGTTSSSGGEGGGGEGGSGGGDGGSGGGTPATFEERVAYAHLVEPFETEEECLAAQDPEFFINCWQVVEFCPDGSASFMLTDIIDPGTYTRAATTIDTAWEGASGAPPEVVFTITSPTELVDDAYGLTWTLDEEGVHQLGGCP